MQNLPVIGPRGHITYPGSKEANQPNSKCYVDYLASQARPLNKNHYFQDEQEPTCTVLPRVVMTKAGLFIIICSSN